MRKFEIDDEQEEQAQYWLKNHNRGKCYKADKGATGGGYSYRFWPTGLGESVTIYCDLCKKEKPLTNGENW